MNYTDTTHPIIDILAICLLGWLIWYLVGWLIFSGMWFTIPGVVVELFCVRKALRIVQIITGDL